MINKVAFTLVLILCGVIFTWAQNPLPAGPSTPADIDSIVNEAEKQTANYQEAFKNLLAVETKTFEQYGKDGEVKEQSVVESNFLVYQSSKNAKISSELRSVINVDGKPVPDSVERSNRFFAELQKTSTLKSELEKIQKEGNRYDKTLEIDGVTLYEGVVLSANMRPYFDFKLTGTENYQGNDVYVVSYLQTKKSPFITLNGKDSDSGGGLDNLNLDFKFDLPKSLKNSDAFLNGKLWIDAKTFQIRREDRFLTVNTDDPVIILETVLEYQPSNYEILVPKKITLTTNEVKNKDNKNTVRKETRVNFDYSEFKKSETDVKILDDTPDKP